LIFVSNKLKTMKHLLNWVEIPATDIKRAKKFYSAILGEIKFRDMENQGTKYALFPVDDMHNSGALVQGEYYKPSSDGITIYLDGGKDMDNILKHVEKAGGEVIMAKTNTGMEAGFVGMFVDSEGNKIGLQHM
jgi:predicted enzyme related to lactoylglutathione lyase